MTYSSYIVHNMVLLVIIGLVFHNVLRFALRACPAPASFGKSESSLKYLSAYLP